MQFHFVKVFNLIPRLKGMNNIGSKHTLTKMCYRIFHLNILWNIILNIRRDFGTNSMAFSIEYSVEDPIEDPKEFSSIFYRTFYRIHIL